MSRDRPSSSTANSPITKMVIRPAAMAPMMSSAIRKFLLKTSARLSAVDAARRLVLVLRLVLVGVRRVLLARDRALLQRLAVGIGFLG